MIKNNKFSFSSALRILMGIIVLNEFVVLWSQKFFTAAGYQQKLQLLYSHSFFSLPKHLLSFLMLGGHVFSIIAAVLLLTTAICLLLGVIRFYATLALSLIFTVYFVAHIGTVGTWVYEFAIPCGFSLLLITSRTAKDKLIGDFQSSCLLKTVVTTLLAAVAIYLVNVGSMNAQNYHVVGLITAITSFILLMLNFLISKKYQSTAIISSAHEQQLLLNKVAIFIGMMLVTQVHMNHLIHWFTPAGYTNLISTYQHYSSIAPYLNFVMEFIKQHVAIILPAQVVLESFLALCLVALVFRPIAFVLSALLFLGLAIIEFGVPGTFPVKHPIEYTWTWELLLTAITMSIISFYEIKRAVTSQGIVQKLLGPTIFSNMTIIARFNWSAMLGLLAFLIVFLSHNIAKQSIIFSIQSGLSVFCYLLLFHLLDGLKKNAFNCVASDCQTT